MLFVRLFTFIGSGWTYRDSTLTSAPPSPKAQLTQPTPGTILLAVSQQFCWTAGTGVTRYWLDIGTTNGAFNILSRDSGTSTCTLVTGLPEGGQTLFIRLFSLIGGVWQYFDYVVIGPVRSQLTDPVPGTTLSSTTRLFQWSDGTGVTRYYLDVGTTGAGSANIASFDAGTQTDLTVSGLPTGGTLVYVRLWSLIDGAWVYLDYVFSTA